jgi:hypothetical protein
MILLADQEYAIKRGDQYYCPVNNKWSSNLSIHGMTTEHIKRIIEKWKNTDEDLQNIEIVNVKKIMLPFTNQTWQLSEFEKGIQYHQFIKPFNGKFSQIGQLLSTNKTWNLVLLIKVNSDPTVSAFLKDRVLRENQNNWRAALKTLKVRYRIFNNIICFADDESAIRFKLYEKSGINIMHEYTRQQILEVYFTYQKIKQSERIPKCIIM